jgi:hypothetical protein
MSWLGRALGDFGSQVGQGYDIAQQWRQRLLDMQMRQAQQRIADVKGPLEIQEIQARLKHMNDPQPQGIVGLPGGGTAGATFTPGAAPGHEYNFQTLAPGAPGPDKAAIKQQIKAMAASAPKEYQAPISGYADSIDQGEDPLKALEKAQTLLGQAAGKAESQANKPEFKVDTKDGIVTAANGQQWAFDDPNMPPKAKTLVESATKAEAKRNADQIGRMLTSMDIHEKEKANAEILKTVTTGLNGHFYLKQVEDQVVSARNTGGVGISSGDLVLLDGYMQLMFGFAPKGMRGSPKMQEFLMKQGGVDDQAIAWWNGVKGGGKLSQDVREQILETSKMQGANYDERVRALGEVLGNDPKAQGPIQRYNKKYGSSPATDPDKKKDDGLGFVPDAPK